MHKNKIFDTKKADFMRPASTFWIIQLSNSRSKDMRYDDFTCSSHVCQFYCESLMPFLYSCYILLIVNLKKLSYNVTGYKP